MYKLPPVVVSVLACAVGVATALLSTVNDFTLKEICIGVIAAGGTFGISHASSPSPGDAPAGADPYLEKDASNA